MNKHCSYNPHLPQHRTNWGMPFGDEFLYNHPACLLGVFNWDERVEMVSGRRQVVRRICFLCWIIHLTLLERIEKQRHIHGLGWNVGAWSSLIKANRETTKCIDRIKASMGNEFKWLWILNFHVKGQAVWSTFFLRRFAWKKASGSHRLTWHLWQAHLIHAVGAWILNESGEREEKLKRKKEGGQAEHPSWRRNTNRVIIISWRGIRSETDYAAT